MVEENGYLIYLEASTSRFYVGSKTSSYYFGSATWSITWITPFF